MSRIKIWVRLICHFIYSIRCQKKSVLLDIQQTTDKVAESKKSVIRFGDGELNILLGKDVHYQKFDEKLQKEFFQLSSDYLQQKENCPYLLCMPNLFLRCSGWKLAQKRVWVSCWSDFRYYFKKYLDRDICYGEAFLFGKGNLPIAEKIWEDKESIIFVHNHSEYAELFQKQYGKTVDFVRIPAENAYERIDEIVNTLEEKIKRLEHPEGSMVLLSAGPCAKAIVYRLRNCGVQIIDTGHCWDDPLLQMEQ